jgi:ArsR family transcriptional regulator
MLQPRVSQHLRVLKEAGFVKENREGYWVYNSLDKEALQRVWRDFMAFLESDINKLESFENVVKRMENAVCNEHIRKTKEDIKENKRIIDDVD